MRKRGTETICMRCRNTNEQRVVRERERELRELNTGFGRLKRTQMRCLLTDKVFQKRKPGGHLKKKKKASFAVGFFPTWQVASQRNHYMREEKGGNQHTCGCASPASVLRSQSLRSPGQGVAKGERQREGRKGEEGRDCGGDLQAWLRAELTFY